MQAQHTNKQNAKKSDCWYLGPGDVAGSALLSTQETKTKQAERRTVGQTETGTETGTRTDRQSGLHKH